jgi:hypothetical protein
MNQTNELKTIQVYPRAVRRPDGFRLDCPQEVCLSGKYSTQKVKLCRGIWIAMEVLVGEGQRKNWGIETVRIG